MDSPGHPLACLQRLAAPFLVILLCGAAALACAQQNEVMDAIRNDQKANAKDQSRSSTIPPITTRTSFDSALRCMDKLFTTYGIRDISMLIEDIPDATKKVNVAAREMFMSATSRMTQRSGAIRLIPFQPNSIAFENRKDFLQRAQYVLQGSVSALDESVIKRQRDGSICLGALCLGYADTDSYSALGLDMNVIRTTDLTLLPGVNSKNSVLLVKHGVGADSEVNLNSFGLNFNMTAGRSDGNGQALRTLLELGSIELYGRLLKIPYWSCLGIAAEQPDVSGEIDDWWETLAGDPSALVTWLQRQMLARGLYRGPIDGIATQALLNAVGAYKGAMGQTADAHLDAAFLRAYFTADHARLEPLAKATLEQQNAVAGTGAGGNDAASADSAGAGSHSATGTDGARAPAGATAGAAHASAAAGSLEVADHRPDRQSYLRGEKYEIEVRAPDDGYLYCWLIDEQHHLTQFFPNPVQPKARISGKSPTVFPGRFPFNLYASRSGHTETVACGLTGKDLGSDPLGPAAGKIAEADSLRRAFGEVVGSSFQFGVLNVTPK